MDFLFSFLQNNSWSSGILPWMWRAKEHFQWICLPWRLNKIKKVAGWSSQNCGWNVWEPQIQNGRRRPVIERYLLNGLWIIVIKIWRVRIQKQIYQFFINLRYLLIKLLKNKENNKKICHIFHHNLKNIPCYVMSEVSLKRFYFGLFDVGLTLKTLKLAFIGFLIQTLHNGVRGFQGQWWVHFWCYCDILIYNCHSMQIQIGRRHWVYFSWFSL